jgi:hypothetical protein
VGVPCRSFFLIGKLRIFLGEIIMYYEIFKIGSGLDIEVLQVVRVNSPQEVEEQIKQVAKDFKLFGLWVSGVPFGYIKTNDFNISARLEVKQTEYEESKKQISMFEPVQSDLFGGLQ